jgi:hypothetical protein
MLFRDFKSIDPGVSSDTVASACRSRQRKAARVAASRASGSDVKRLHRPNLPGQQRADMPA